jgi:hypothetical protein
MLISEGSGLCGCCCRRVLIRRNAVGELLCGGGAIAWLLLVTLPALVPCMEALTEARRTGNLRAFMTFGFLYLFIGIMPAAGLGVAAWWAHRRSPWRCSRCGTALRGRAIG